MALSWSSFRGFHSQRFQESNKGSFRNSAHSFTGILQDFHPRFPHGFLVKGFPGYFSKFFSDIFCSDLSGSFFEIFFQDCLEFVSEFFNEFLLGFLQYFLSGLLLKLLAIFFSVIHKVSLGIFFYIFSINTHRLIFENPCWNLEKSKVELNIPGETQNYLEEIP